ncbi:MAG: hypothetical protein E6922_10200 [Veillonella sp.]|nr:hypothetical protein [Veillonella sp.]
MFSNAHAELRLTVFQMPAFSRRASSWRVIPQRTTALPHCPDESWHGSSGTTGPAR